MAIDSGATARDDDRRAYAEMDLLRLYLDELGWHSLLDRSEEARLAQLVQEGLAASKELHAVPPPTRARRAQLQRTVAAGRRAREEFARANLRLVVSIAKHYQHRGVELTDLIQEGNIGLLHAVERFDWRRGYKFSTYATWWIRKGVAQAVGDTSTAVRLPRHRREQAKAISEASERLERRLGHAPGAQDLADETGMRMADIVAIRRAAAPVVSMSSPIDDDGNELGDLVADDGVDVGESATATLLPAEVERLLEGLPASSQNVLRLRYGIGSPDGPLTSAQVGAVLKISPERVRQIEGRALAALRHRVPRVDWAS